MKRYYFTAFIFTLCLFVLPNYSFKLPVETITTQAVLTKMTDAIAKIKSLKFVLQNTERIDGAKLQSKQYIKCSYSPFKCYVYMGNPHAGVEILFCQGKNNGMAKYNPNGFPYVNLDLDPYGSLMREDNHHTILELGFSYFGSIISSFYKQKSAFFSYKGEVTWDGKTCYKIDATATDYKYVIYKMLAGENINKVARKLNIPEYKILEINPAISDYSYSVPGKDIIVPNYYAKNLELYIDKTTCLPILIKVSDDKGFFEQFEFYKLSVNPAFTDKDFNEGALGQGLKGF